MLSSMLNQLRLEIYMFFSENPILKHQVQEFENVFLNNGYEKKSSHFLRLWKLFQKQFNGSNVNNCPTLYQMKRDGNKGLNLRREQNHTEMRKASKFTFQRSLL